MNPNRLPQFDFDGWSRLAKRDPQGFEHRRRQILERLIDSAPAAKRPRLRALQWRIDQVRHRAASPLGACVRLTQMMWDSMAGERGLLAALQGRPRSHPPKAPVLAFRAPARRRL